MPRKIHNLHIKMIPATPISTKNKLESQELFKISRFKPLIKKTKPHKHEGYFELIFIAEGEGFHWIETESYQVQTPDFYFLKPGQLHFWQFTAIPKGYVMMFKEEFVDAV
ncbi:AraC family ligand binding domain-containing protein, partial [Mongoliibacter sp.]|uniref:AraC family ligand binding domain-containing protein n=1 Tax=Mongoliibacter sp. TaxID=2022438 RepID=UPI0025EAA672